MPILYGDNRNIVLAPHNVGYSNLIDHLGDAKIPVSASYVKNYSKPVLTNGDRSSYSLLDESDFFKLALPDNFINASLLLTPQNYLDAILKRMKIFTDIQTKISESKLNSDEEKMLHVAIQGYFREWLVTNNHHKKINELIKLIDK